MKCLIIHINSLSLNKYRLWNSVHDGEWTWKFFRVPLQRCVKHSWSIPKCLWRFLASGKQIMDFWDQIRWLPLTLPYGLCVNKQTRFQQGEHVAQWNFICSSSRYISLQALSGLKKVCYRATFSCNHVWVDRYFCLYCVFIQCGEQPLDFLFFVFVCIGTILFTFLICQ